MMTVTSENAMNLYYENLSNLDNSIDAWTEAEIKDFKANGKKAIEEDGWYMTALDYNSTITVLKAILES